MKSGGTAAFWKGPRLSLIHITGHQQNPTTGYNIKGEPAGKIDLEQLCRAMGFERVRVCLLYTSRCV